MSSRGFALQVPATRGPGLML